LIQETYCATNSAGDEVGENALLVYTRIARIVEISLDDCVILWVKFENDLVACLRMHGVWTEHKTVLAH
jgi:hypothetical protein